MIDWLLANPGSKTLQPLADEMSVSRTWLSIVMRSDVFIEEYMKRRQAHASELTRQICEKQLKVTLQALDKLEDIIDDSETDDRLVFDIANKTAQQLGYTPSGGMEPSLEMTERTRETEERQVGTETILRARETMRTVRTVRDGNALPAPDG